MVRANRKDRHRISNAALGFRRLLLDGTKRFEGKRDFYTSLGYIKKPDFNHYMTKYVRGDIAQRIINCFPEATWSKHPFIFDQGDLNNESDFEKSFKNLARRINLYTYITRLDKLANLGQYAILFIGVRDGRDVESPIGKITGQEDILYLMPFSEQNTCIKTFVTDFSNERYGLPETYELTLGGYGDDGSEFMEQRKQIVHASRIIHVAEGILENEVFGLPRLQCVLNRLDDLEKVIGGSSEIFWINGRGGLNINAPAELDVKDLPKLTEEINNYQHNYTRVLKTRGMEVKTLNMPVDSPESHARVIIDLISSATAIPKRILLGSERGELSSSQDEKNWWGRVRERCQKFCEPVILRPIIDKFISIGALPYVEKYEIEWEDFITDSDKEKSDVAMRNANAIATYVNANEAGMLIPPRQFVEKVMGLDYREKDIKDFQEQYKKEEGMVEAMRKAQDDIDQTKQELTGQKKGMEEDSYVE